MIHLLHDTIFVDYNFFVLICFLIARVDQVHRGPSHDTYPTFNARLRWNHAPFARLRAQSG
jgi:hypothetical protein